MGWKLVPSTIKENPNKILGVSLNFNESGVFSKVYTDVKQARANLIHLLLTQKGERLYQPLFGSDLLRIIFEPNVDLIKERIQNMIFDAVQYWMPYLQISVDVQTADDDPNLTDNVKVTIEGSVDTIYIEKIEIYASERGITISNL